VTDNRSLDARTGWWLVASIGVVVLACASRQPRTRTADVSQAGSNIETTVFLIGDTGEPGPAGRSVLRALRETVHRAGGERVIVFLGDNVYPNGVPDSTAADRSVAEDKLRAAIAVVVATGARGIFVPGNHDWGSNSELGALAREERFIARESAGAALLLPANGCPGPAIVDVGTQLRLTALDTEWWLRSLPQRTATSCPNATERVVGDGLREALAGAGDRRVVIAGHHPLVSGGPHGGHFGWREHVFPFRDFANWMWVPLPVLGSAYPFTRARVGLEEDIFGAANSRMRATLESAFVAHPPLVYAAGHDHGLQVLNGASARFLVVSGGGSDGDLDSVHAVTSTLFALSANGFVRLELTRDGHVRLSVLTVAPTADVAAADGPMAVERFAIWLM
jgi:hypothetical protein